MSGAAVNVTNTHAPRPLSQIVAGAGVAASVPDDVLVSDITLDSRAVSPGALFLACKGLTHHGLEFAQQAVTRGARAVLFEQVEDAPVAAPEFGSEIFVAGVPELSRHVGAIADRFFDSPSQSLTVVGVTGTNGKTTSAYLLAQALELCGRPSGYIGTLGHGKPGALIPSEHTTADAVSVHRRLARFRDEGAECVAMEVSSHALDQGRVNGVRFNTAVFTNLTRDHLDYHGTMEAYGAAKARLFPPTGLALQVINVDDPFGAELAFRRSVARLIVTARTVESASRLDDRDVFVRASRYEATPAGLAIDIESSWGSARLSVPLIGEFNVDNVLGVLAVLVGWNIPLDQAAKVLGQCRAPSGRMEIFGGQQGRPLVVVDYAHTPDALSKALHAARKHTRGKLSVVFGCGGDRDKGKRPLMGRVAVDLADEVIITDDNPRTEDAAQIVADILVGATLGASLPQAGSAAPRTSATTTQVDASSSAQGRAVPPQAEAASDAHGRAAPVQIEASVGAQGRVAPTQVDVAATPAGQTSRLLIEHDRARAIALAIEKSAADDVVLVAGKGHEDYQIIGTTRRPFSDQAVVRRQLEGERA